MGPITWFDIWWNSEVQIWTIQAKDADDNQIGDAGYGGRKSSAIKEAKSWRNNLSSCCHENSDIKIWVEQRTNFEYREVK
tara:strand:- start:1535 stop:1774 length:240 start_codon:yes stop_codon:yes gene_type:complete